MEEYKSLPSMEHRFQIQVKGDRSSINWVGDFLYKRPSLGEQSQIERLKVELSGDLQNIDSEYSNLNFILAYLRFTIHEYPTWWKESSWGSSLYDFNVIETMYDECMGFENEWSKRLHEKVDKGKFTRTSKEDKLPDVQNDKGEGGNEEG